MEQFLNALKGHASALDRTGGQARFGLVASVDGARYAARVRLQPEDVLSGWLPVLSLWVGAGWGMVALPAPGDQVLVVAQEGDAENGVILGACFSAAMPPPASAPGEIRLVHASGSSLQMSNDGKIRITGDLIVDGAVSDRHGPLDRLRGLYDRHTHPAHNTVTADRDEEAGHG